MIPSTKICTILVKSGLISKTQAKEALQREHSIRDALEKQRAKKQQLSTSTIPVKTPFSFVDVLAALKISRLDIPELTLDEDLLYETIANHLSIPYKKIDPLKLDLNLVTKTIPRSFAMKHLLLPLKVDDGILQVATPEPFNYDAIADVERVTNFKVMPVISSKSDIKRVIREFYGFKHSISAAEDHFSHKRG